MALSDRATPRLALYAFAAVVALALFVAGTTSGAAFGAFNPGWDGSSSLQSLAEDGAADGELLRNASRYDEFEADGTVAFALSPDEAYGERDAAAVRRFVEGGGTLLVAADFGSGGNALLDAVGADARVDGRLVRDERHYAGGPALPVATDVSDHRYTDGVDRLTLNHGSVVEAGGNATTLAATSSFAYLDGDRDGELDDDEALASRPVATVEAVGEGRVVVVSDPSLFINAMLDQPDNERFARALLADHERAVFDVSHAGSVPPLTGAALALRDSAAVQALVGLGGLLLIAGWPRLRAGVAAVRSRRRQSAPAAEPSVGPDAVVERLRERRPEWDEARLERVTQGIMTTEEKTTGDD
ncbi:DUF4350 domain-containing protein [Halomicrobium salinisoli]|uniref:DUF4350 domain-containing protein n=1 Tax=Halomicrobium salinisoli TaxID=2878391 RepID=UPI001CEFE342|nr:DUF4350 domain-containing protein [Halomicrobium salinisoli]